MSKASDGNDIPANGASTWNEDTLNEYTLDPMGNVGSGSDGTDGNPDDPPDPTDDTPLAEWVKYHRDNYLDEFIRHEGRTGMDCCRNECQGEGLYKCKDCFGCRLWCRTCFVEQHAVTPLHRGLVSHLLLTATHC